MLHKTAMLPVALLATAIALPAQWTESGDAGDLPRTAQAMSGTIPALPSISGTLSGSDVDMYWIDIVDPAVFSATTIGGTAIDTQLWLFLPDGRGVVHQDGLTPSLQSTITGAFVPAPGTYLLAISSYNRDPLAMGGPIWNDAPYDVQRSADGPRRGEAVDAWAGTGFNTGAYTITLTGCKRSGRELLAPDNHHLSESAVQTGAAGSTAWWRTGGGRFQILYEASHFTNTGISGGIYIDQLMFRGEDGEPNRGGQSWANVVVRLARTTLTPGTLTNDFAGNLAASTQVSAPVLFPTVTVARSLGATPNNYNIVLDLFASPIVGYYYDPTGGNLLIDVTIPAAATVPAGVGPVMAIQDTSGTAAIVRGAGVTTATATAATGTLSTAPPVVGFKLDGGGAMPLIPARNEFYGAACGGAPSAFYEGFLTGQAFDLTGLTLTPDNPAAPNFYTVTGGAPAFDATQVNATPNLSTDEGAVTHALGFSFAYPGGVTTSIRPTTNGFVWLNSNSLGSDFSITLAEFLGAGARLAPFWYDFDGSRNTSANANAGMHVLTTGTAPNRVCYVTWFQVGAFDSVGGSGINGHAVYDMQMAIFETTNVVQFRYGTMPSYTSNNEADDPSFTGIVGFSRGAIGTTPSVDPQSRDLSVEVPFATKVEGAFGNMGQRVVATPGTGGVQYNGRAFAGQTLTFGAVNVPPASTIGLQLLDFAASRPGINIPGIHAAGCGEGVSLNPVIHQVFLFPGATVVGTTPLPIPAGVEGFNLHAQFATLDLSGGTLVPALSNPVRITVGRD